MSNRVLLIGGNFYPEPTGIGKYSGEMIDWMSENGYSCTVITTFPYYPDWKVRDDYAKSRYWFKKEVKPASNKNGNPITIIRCPHYIPTSPTGFKRLLSEFTISFFCYLALLGTFFMKRYNFVLTVAPPFELGLLGVLYKKLRGSILIYHIQDLQIDAAKELKMVKSSFALKALSSVEKYILKNSDHISSISEGMIRKLQVKTDKEIILFPNWVNTNSFYPIQDKEKLKVEFGFKPTDKIVLYSGAIGVKQGLESMIISANSFSSNENVVFVICGSGPYKDHLIKFGDDVKATNVVFLPLQKPSNMNSFLNMADLHLIIQKSNASDLMMPSKLSTILATGGIAIVTASPGSGLYDIISSSDIGILVEPENQHALNKAIDNALKSTLTNKRQNARSYAIRHLCISHVLPNFRDIALGGRAKKYNELREGSVLLSK